MRRITAIVALVALIATKSMSQSATPQKASWEPYNSAITAGAVTALGIIVATRYPVEITPQIGPTINWFRNESLSFRTNLRLASGLADNLRLAYGAYTQNAQILFGVSFRPKSK